MAAVLIGLAAVPALAAESGQRLVLGRISGEPRKHVRRLQAMADYLSFHLAGNGIAGVDVLVVESPERMRRLLEAGSVDLFSETAFAALDFMQNDVATPLLREWKRGVAEYHTVIIARKDGGLRELSDLNGHNFAFEDPDSTSGYMIPRVALEAAGLRLQELADPRSASPDDAVGYSFAGGEINVVAWVNRGLADAGAISNLDWSDPDSAPAALRNDLIVIHQTEPVVRSLIMARKSLDGDLTARIAAILESMHETSEGRAVLKKYFKVARYDRLEGDALRGLEAARAVWRQFGARPR